MGGARKWPENGWRVRSGVRAPLAYVCLCMYSSQLLCLWPCTVQYAVNLHFLLLITYREHLGLVDDYQVSDSECFDPLSDAFYRLQQ